MPSLVACKITIETDDIPITIPGQSQKPSTGEIDSEKLPNQNNNMTTPPVQEPEDISQTLPNTQPTVQNDIYIRALTNGLNVRSAPKTNSTVLGSLDKNDMLIYIEKQDNWYKTVFKNQTAYVSALSQYTELYTLPRSTKTAIEKVIDLGYTRMGYEYVYGATRLHNGKGVLLKDFNNTEYDCSSLMQYIFYYGADILLDVTTRTQVVQGQHVDKDKVQRGDLLFYTNANRKNNVGVEKIGHVALYLGNNYILHTSSDHAVIEPMSKTRQSYLIEGRRFL